MKRKLYTLGAILLALFVGFSPLIMPQQASAQSRTVVSLTFDDGQATQYSAARVLASHGMHGTFYVNSGMVGVGPWYMTWDQIHVLGAQGNEIGGHTLMHKDLTKIPLKQAFTEIRSDRANLLAQGFSASSLAYPYGVTTPEVEQIAQQAGYSSARGVGGGVQSIPPLAPYFMMTATDYGQQYTLKKLKADVQRAEAVHGWVNIVFHQFDTDSTESIPLAMFTQFIAWLQSQPVSVETVQQVMGLGKPSVPKAKVPVTPAVQTPPAKTTPHEIKIKPKLAGPSAEDIAAARLAAFEAKLHHALVFKLNHVGVS